MPGVARKVVVFATVDSLILQPHGGWDHSKSLRIDFKSRSIAQCPFVEPDKLKESPLLDCHGVVGILTIASFSYLLCITARQQVAQIFGKPVYVIKDVAILPLMSQSETDQAITQALATTRKGQTSGDSSTASSASEDSEQEGLDDNSVGDPPEPGSPSKGSRPTPDRSVSTTSVVQDVIERKGQYGRFASNWFSKRGWGLNSTRTEGISKERVQKPDQAGYSPPDGTLEPNATEEPAATASEAVQTLTDRGSGQSSQRPPREAAVEMLPKILRTVRLLLTSSSYYFSYDFDITRRWGSVSMASLRSMSTESIEQQYFWNRQLAIPFSQAGCSSVVLPIMQGFVGQKPFIVKKSLEEKAHAEAIESSKSVPAAASTEAGQDSAARGDNGPQAFLLTLISRRSVKRSGLRYLRRGIDDEGNCANTVETEQILSTSTWENPATIRSFVQVRASVPLYFSQSPYAFKPVPVLHQSRETNRRAFDRHFEDLRRRYGSVQIVQLIDKKGGEKKIGTEYESVSKASNEGSETPTLGFEWFDFHSECRGMKFENVQKLVETLGATINSFGETVVDGSDTRQRQTGIIRTNCMDCLDRTNVVQSAFAQYVLQKELEREGLKIDFVHDSSTQWFNAVWADNGDAISRQYASTAALKGDYTRTRKRDYRGALNDFRLTVTRYYNNIVNDYFSQAVVDVLLGNVTPKIFDDFEASMISADPGVSIEKIRQNAIDTCSKIVIQHPEEELIHGWAMLTPAQTNTLRTLPFEEAILLLTDSAIYGCKFDWNTEKVASFERIDLHSVTKIYYGTYITSTLTEGQMDEDLNVGLVLSYTPGKESIKRVNTRSLQVAADTDSEAGRAKQGEGVAETGILSWLHTRNPKTSQCMAMKVIPNRSLSDEKVDSSPLDTADRICQDIKRTIIDNIGHGKEEEVDLIEKSDIISLADARSRTGYLEQIGYSIKKLVWT